MHVITCVVCKVAMWLREEYYKDRMMMLLLVCAYLLCYNSGDKCQDREREREREGDPMLYSSPSAGKPGSHKTRSGSRCNASRLQERRPPSSAALHR